MSTQEVERTNPDWSSHRRHLLAAAKRSFPTVLNPGLDASDVVQEALLVAHIQTGNARPTPISERPSAEQTGNQGNGLPPIPERQTGQTEQTSTAAWLRRLLSGKLVDALRRETRQKRDCRRTRPTSAGFSPAEVGIEAIAVSDQTTPSVRLDRQSALEQVQSALTGLPDSQRQAITLRYDQQLSIAEISRITGKSPVAVAGLIKRGLSKLREQLNPGVLP